jgi:hypothetical protein
MLLFRALLFLMLVGAGLCFAFFIAATNNLRFRRWGMQLLKYALLTALVVSEFRSSAASSSATCAETRNHVTLSGCARACSCCCDRATATCPSACCGSAGHEQLRWRDPAWAWVMASPKRIRRVGPGAPRQIQQAPHHLLYLRFGGSPVADHGLLHLQSGVLGHRQLGLHQRGNQGPRACPSSSVDCGFTLTKTISTAAQSGW